MSHRGIGSRRDEGHTISWRNRVPAFHRLRQTCGCDVKPRTIRMVSYRLGVFLEAFEIARIYQGI
jgi:hypothetical protein